jgi:hypothetical protein
VRAPGSDPPLGGLVAVSVAMFADSFCYGMIGALAIVSPAAAYDWGPSALHGAYAAGVGISTPVFATLTDRVGLACLSLVRAAMRVQTV